jgi:hypothetical protein
MALVVVALALEACAAKEPAAAAEAPLEQAPETASACTPERSSEQALVEERPAILPALPDAPRGLGSMTARVPGTRAVVSGVRLAAHHARVTVAAGVAHTEIEEVFQNDTDSVLEGRFVFPLSSDATVSRLALWVGKVLVEGEMVERKRADTIFRGIVDDTVRPRDPALLEMVAGGKVSLRVFPIAPRGSRTVLIGYDQVLRTEGDGVRYVLPMSLGADRATAIDQVSLTVNGASHLAASAYVPAGDLSVFVEGAPPPLVFSPPAGKSGESFAAVRARVEAPGGRCERVGGDVVLVLDVSEAQSAETLTSQIHLADAVLQRLEEGESFALLACDSGCEGYPEVGRSTRSPASIEGARRFLSGLRPAGSSDLAGALADAAARLDPERGGQILISSDGGPTSGELAPASIVAHASAVMGSRPGLDVRLIGAGRAIDEPSLLAVAQGLGATYDRLATGAPLAARIEELAGSRRVAAVRSPAIALPSGLTAPMPGALPSVRAGEELVVVARVDAAGAAGAEATGTPTGVPTSAPLGRLWARGKIAALEARGDEAAAEIVSLSRRHHVLSRFTSLLVLENDRMFAEFGIARTAPRFDAEHGAPGATGAMGQSAGEGFGAGHGRLGGEHLARAPQVRMGSTTVSGRLPPEVIQRIVRQNFGRFRACYQDGLRRRKDLAGRVTVRFVIGRDGSVMSLGNGGSDLGDAAVIACVIRAFGGLSFPQPEGGIVVVTYPILFSESGAAERPAGASDARPLPTPTPHGHGWISWSNDHWAPPSSRYKRPSWRYEQVEPQAATASHRPGDDRWMNGASVARLAAAVARSPGSRRAREALVRREIAAGRFEEAYADALAFVALDPDLPSAREALADAATVSGRERDALMAMDGAAALESRRVSRHLGAARAFVAAGDDRRACAHLRALGDLAPKDYSEGAVRCRNGEGPALPAPKPGPFEVELTCAEGSGEACPSVAVVTPSGHVMAPATSRGSWRSGPGGRTSGVSFAALEDGTYRTVITSGDRMAASVRVRALGSSLVVAEGTTSAEGALTLVSTTVRIPPRWPRWRRAFVRI